MRVTKPSRRSVPLDTPLEKTSWISGLSGVRVEGETFGKWSESFARFMGTPAFLVQMTVFIAAWLGWNVLAPPAWRFDPYTFTFLTLILSLQASYAAPLILLAQNRQDDRDRMSITQDRRRAERSLSDTEFLTREVVDLRIRMGELVTRSYLKEQLATDTVEDRLNRIEEQLARMSQLLEAGVHPADRP